MIWTWLKQLLFGPAKDPAQQRPRSWPTREAMALLPPFDSLRLTSIVEIASAPDARRAYDDLRTHTVLGFDTESRPTFVRGQVSTGPHVAQFATRDRGYVFLLHHPECRKVVCDLLAAPSIKKVGFGLNEDLRRIPIRLGVQPKAVLDLESLFAKKGHGRGVGVKVGVAIALKRRFLKSRKVSTSNWMRHRLAPNQLLYAANDAYAAICVYHVLTK